MEYTSSGGVVQRPLRTQARAAGAHGLLKKARPGKAGPAPGGQAPPEAGRLWHTSKDVGRVNRPDFSVARAKEGDVGSVDPTYALPAGSGTAAQSAAVAPLLKSESTFLETGLAAGGGPDYHRGNRAACQGGLEMVAAWL